MKICCDISLELSLWDNSYEIMQLIFSCINDENKQWLNTMFIQRLQSDTAPGKVVVVGLEEEKGISMIFSRQH